MSHSILLSTAFAAVTAMGSATAHADTFAGDVCWKARGILRYNEAGEARDLLLAREDGEGEIILRDRALFMAYQAWLDGKFVSYLDFATPEDARRQRREANDALMAGTRLCTRNLKADREADGHLVAREADAWKLPGAENDWKSREGVLAEFVTDPACPTSPKPEIEGYLDAPLVHGDKNSGTFKLYYQFAAPFDPKLPTIISMNSSQEVVSSMDRLTPTVERFHLAGKFNFVQIHPRGGWCSSFTDLNTARDFPWQELWRRMQWQQGVEDHELLRKEILRRYAKGRNAKPEIGIFGSSGAGEMGAKYLAAHPGGITHAFLASFMVNPVRALQEATAWFEAEIVRQGIAHDLQTVLASLSPDARRNLGYALQKGFDQPTTRVEMVQMIRDAAQGRREALEKTLQARDVYKKAAAYGWLSPAVTVFMVETTGLAKEAEHPYFSQPWVAALPLRNLLAAGKISLDMAPLRNLERTGHVSTLVVAQEKDHILPPALQREAYGRIPRASFALFNAYHSFAPLTETAECAGHLVREFFGGHADTRMDFEAMVQNDICKSFYVSSESKQPLPR